MFSESYYTDLEFRVKSDLLAARNGSRIKDEYYPSSYNGTLFTTGFISSGNSINSTQSTPQITPQNTKLMSRVGLYHVAPF